MNKLYKTYQKFIDWPGFPYYSWWQIIIRLPFAIIHDVGLLISAFCLLVLDKGGAGAVSFVKENRMLGL